MGPLYSDCSSDTKTRFFKSSSQAFACVEAICPQPHRAVRLPYFIEDLSRVSPEPKSILPRSRDKTGSGIISVLLNKEDREVNTDIGGGGNEISYFCGSPPVRAHNPVIHDAQFIKQTNPIASFPLSPARVERGGGGGGGGSPICSSPTITGSPKIRVEGFTCGKSDPLCVVTTLA